MPAKKKSAKKRPLRKTAKSIKTEPKMLSIWFFVGLMLTVLGVIVTATGIYYIFRPQNATRLAELNPNLWWGAIILVAGFIFLIPSWRRFKKEKR